MKTTLDLPDELMKRVKLRALQEGRKLKDEVATLLRAGMEALPGPGPTTRRYRSPRIMTDPKTGLPVIICGRRARASKMTAEQLIAIEHQTQTQEDLERVRR